MSHRPADPQVKTVRDSGIRFVREDGSGAWIDEALLHLEAFDPNQEVWLRHVGNRYGKDIALAVRVRLWKIKKDAT